MLTVDYDNYNKREYSNKRVRMMSIEKASTSSIRYRLRVVVIVTW